ncbi:hypothetical protein DPMN_018596 [Dreissena polymorpha]|uniref:Ricin B lectin domain-containing protein n=1 Tax=Dreissena polymorpha TaxID=45954 RepID=A0A9D4NJ25_DREPO|nr:hypothetical protein DPMN_018596 [Dreissena polymorpha]
MPVEYHALGEIKNKQTGGCVDSMGRKSGEKVGLVHCHGMGGNQIFSYTSKQALQTDDVCLDVSAIGGPVKLFQCHGLGGNQKWEYSRELTKLMAVATDPAFLEKRKPACLSLPVARHVLCIVLIILVFAFMGKGQLMMDDNVCITSARGVIKFQTCEADGPKWDYNKETHELRHVNSNQCLGKASDADKEAPSIGPCDGSEEQKWTFSDMKM